MTQFSISTFKQLLFVSDVTNDKWYDKDEVP